MSLLRRGLAIALAAAVAGLVAGSAPARTSLEPPGLVEVVVTLDSPPLARAAVARRELASSRSRLSLRAPASVLYLRRLAAAQRVVETRIENAIPGAYARWSYGVVLNGFAVVVPAGSERRLAAIPGVARVYPNVRYHPLLDRSPGQIGAPTLWGPTLANAGQGVKIGIIDDGLDRTHPFFAPSGYSMPAGFPKGNTAFTSAKVIVARAFAPAKPAWRYATRPFDPQNSEHATHVAGIAAGNAKTVVEEMAGRPVVSGIAPKAYLGNYKVLSIPTPEVGLDGNAAEIVAGIEAAVRDGMDVINLSLGEPEIEPSRDLVTTAIDAAAAAGVVPVIAAGNDFSDLGRGTVGSPGSAARAITVAAVTTTRTGQPNRMADFSSSGPTPVSLRMKPDVSAPGVAILSSVPERNGLWQFFSGTSMASPHVAGGVALLRQRHPDWTVDQIKSALVTTGDPGLIGSNEAATTREGGGVINLPRANDPRLFASPTGLAFGLMQRNSAATRTVELTDAGGGAGTWNVSIQQGAGPTVSAPTSVTVPGSLPVTATVGPGAGEQETTGFVVLTRGGFVRHLPFWFRVTAPLLGSEPRTALTKRGVYRGNTRGKQSRVSTYRYPDNPSSLDIPVQLNGPEQVFRVRLARPVANFGAAVLSQGAGVHVEPRVVVAGDENRLTGYPALPINLNPYVANFLRLQPVVGAIRPAAGAYDIVFDTPTASQAGPFTFRFWIDDARPPTVTLPTRTVARGRPLTVRIGDAASGVDPATLVVSVDGQLRNVRISAGRLRLPTSGLAPGRHRLIVEASDYQEAKNMEDVPQIKPNTRIFRAVFRVR